jgi:hypothetical protein
MKFVKAVASYEAYYQVIAGSNADKKLRRK